MAVCDCEALSNVLGIYHRYLKTPLRISMVRGLGLSFNPLYYINGSSCMDGEEPAKCVMRVNSRTDNLEFVQNVTTKNTSGAR